MIKIINPKRKLYNNIKLLFKIKVDYKIGIVFKSMNY